MSIYAPQTKVARNRRARTGRILGVLLLLGGAAVVGPQAFASDGPVDPVEIDSYTVASGETLWSIAAALTPAGRDVRDTIGEIQHLNSMSGSGLVAGQQIYLPVVD
ncbi:LysM peptidoglycan-binding domain-containing protein [Demequina sp.]|uniref:LysM peptidoglycan-binding domain-containing protein n=1 Tax=Demequina sp. TaxID=2050685 RepID=UPI0025FE85B2|nr:LysM peptidoglycan-binding domain-containing protein [Demequina sp.]